MKKKLKKSRQTAHPEKTQDAVQPADPDQTSSFFEDDQDLDIPDIVTAGRSRTRNDASLDEDDGGIEISAIEIDGIEISTVNLAKGAGDGPSAMITIEDRSEADPKGWMQCPSGPPLSSENGSEEASAPMEPEGQSPSSLKKEAGQAKNSKTPNASDRRTVRVSSTISPMGPVPEPEKSSEQPAGENTRSDLSAIPKHQAKTGTSLSEARKSGPKAGQDKAAAGSKTEKDGSSSNGQNSDGSPMSPSGTERIEQPVRAASQEAEFTSPALLTPDLKTDATGSLSEPLSQAGSLQKKEAKPDLQDPDPSKMQSAKEASSSLEAALDLDAASSSQKSEDKGGGLFSKGLKSRKKKAEEKGREKNGQPEKAGNGPKKKQETSMASPDAPGSSVRSAPSSKASAHSPDQMETAAVLASSAKPAGKILNADQSPSLSENSPAALTASGQAGAANSARAKEQNETALVHKRFSDEETDMDLAAGASFERGDQPKTFETDGSKASVKKKKSRKRNRRRNNRNRSEEQAEKAVPALSGSQDQESLATQDEPTDQSLPEKDENSSSRIQGDETGLSDARKGADRAGSKEGAPEDGEADGLNQNRRRWRYKSGKKPERTEPEPAEPVSMKRRILRLLLNPGTWALLIVAGATLILLSKMVQLSLFKVSLAGIALGIGLVGMAIAGYWFYFTRSRWWQVPGILLCAGLVLLSVLGQGKLSAISQSLQAISSPAQPFIQSIGLYTPSLAPLHDLAAVNNESVGIVTGRNAGAVQALLEDLQSKGIGVHIKNYSSLQQLYKAVRGQAIRAAILTPVDARLIEEFNGVSQANNQLSSMYSLSFNSNVAVPASAKNLEQDPYTVLVSVSNEPLSEKSYRSSLNLLVTVNPQTRRILTTVIPKSLYVSSHCVPELACAPPESPDRVSFTSYHSIEALRETLEHLFDTPIDFAVRLDLDNLLQLFDVSPGSILFRTDTGYADLEGGTPTYMTGPQIKRYLGNLEDLSADDLNQELNQLRVLLTLSHAYRQTDLLNMETSLNILEDAVWTSFSYEQLTQILRMFYLFPEPVSSFYELITGVLATPYSPTLTEAAFVSVAEQEDLDHAKAAIRTLLEGGEPAVTGLPDPSALNPEQPAPSVDEATPQEETAPQNGETGQPALTDLQQAQTALQPEAAG